jgi:N-methylhydantoinase A/oxoprolinase/acetone carboxylase beta subunit
MITTKGYRDIIHIGRHQRPQNYSIMQDIPWQSRPFVRRRHRQAVTERLIPPLGEVLIPLDVLDGFISRASARCQYRVVITEDLRIDEAATEKLRAQR